MDLNLLIIAAVLVVAAANAQKPRLDDGNPIRGNDYGMHLRDQCNETVCHAPCEGAAPPPTCPTNIPECPSGCACFKDCSTNKLICFMIKDCPKGDPFEITKRRHARAVSQEAVDLDSVVQATGGHMEQELPASTVDSDQADQILTAPAIGLQGENKIPASDITNDINELNLASIAVTQAANQSTEVFPASIVAHHTDERTKQYLVVPTISKNQRAEQDLPESTVQVKDGRVDLDLPAPTDAHRIDGGTSLDLQASTISQRIPEVSSGRKERDIPAPSQVIQKIPGRIQTSEKKVEEVTIMAKVKSINAGVEIVVDPAAVCVVFFTCLYRCIGH